jgi:hypothetical protein
LKKKGLATQLTPLLTYGGGIRFEPAITHVAVMLNRGCNQNATKKRYPFETSAMLMPAYDLNGLHFVRDEQERRILTFPFFWLLHQFA